MAGNTKAALQQCFHCPDPSQRLPHAAQRLGALREGPLGLQGGHPPTALPASSAQSCCSPSGKAGRGFTPLLQDSPQQLLGTTGMQRAA